YMVNAFRHGILGISDIGLAQAFAVILGFIAALTVFSLNLLDRGVGLRS
ncbi:MAG: ABC transporter permease, partial [Gammaproteobacteria bacterium]